MINESSTKKGKRKMRKVIARQCERIEDTMKRKGPEHEEAREKENEKERSGRVVSAQEMEAKIEARGNQAAMKDSAIQDAPKPRRASPGNTTLGKEEA